MPKPCISYNRTPSSELRALLKPGQFLSPIIDLRSNNMEVSGLGLDIHFRREDVIHVYCGLTRVIALKRLHRSGDLKLNADKFYMNQACGKALFRKWNSNDPNFARELHHYLDNVEVHTRHRTKEGCIQQAWSHILEAWIPFDREARLAYRSKEYRESARTFQGVENAYCQLMTKYEKHRNGRRNDRWVEPSKTGIKVDQLAIDSKGRLVVIEIKDADKGSESEIYYSPLQLLQYVWEWKQSLDNVPTLLRQIQSLLDARVKVKLIESPQSRLTGEVRAAVCFDADGRSPEVKRRYRIVMDIVNRHLPPGVEPIETWMIGDDEKSAVPVVV